MLWKKKRKREKRKGEEPMKDNGNLKKKNIAFFSGFATNSYLRMIFKKATLLLNPTKLWGKRVTDGANRSYHVPYLYIFLSLLNVYLSR